MGTLTGKFYSNTVTHTLNASSNAALFAAMKAYFEAGNSVLVLYNGETSSQQRLFQQLCPRHQLHNFSKLTSTRWSGIGTAAHGGNARSGTG